MDVHSDIIRQQCNNLATNSKAILIEGFPCHEGQLNTLNKCFGGVDLVILLDCEETTLIDRLHQRRERLKRVEDESAVVLQRISFFKHCTLPVIRYYDERGKLVTISGDREHSDVFNNLISIIEFFLRVKSESNNETPTNNTLMKTEEIIPVISKLLKHEHKRLITGVTIDDDQSLETSFEDSVAMKEDDPLPSSQLLIDSEYTDQNELTSDNLGNSKKTSNNDFEKYKFIFVIGSNEEIRRLYCKHLLKQCNYNYISMKSIMDSSMNLNNEKISFNLNKLIEIITEEMNRTRKIGYIIDGIPNSLSQAKEIEAYNDSLKFSNCKLIILLEEKITETNHSEDISDSYTNNIDKDLIEFLESSKKLYRVPCSRSEDEIAYQLHNLFS
ncbi:unnamed protein product [Schistosoma turkestanicum]|nr:unnamed protein product [Schistosoma turkestanicum]CAH8491080.1 unnamed protein product [Schistosoma turkestanicum]